MPEEQWRKVGMSGSLRGKRSEETKQSNTSSSRGVESKSLQSFDVTGFCSKLKTLNLSLLEYFFQSTRHIRRLGQLINSRWQIR